MDTALQDVAFGFFEDLSLEEKDRVTQILYGPKGKEPELPWEAVIEPESCDAAVTPDAAPHVRDLGPPVIAPGFCVAGPSIMPMHPPTLPVDYRIMYVPPHAFWEMPPPGIDMPPPQAMVMPTGPLPPHAFPAMPVMSPHVLTDMIRMPGVKTVSTHNSCSPNIGETVGRAPDLVPGFPVMNESSRSHAAPGYMPSAMSKAEVPSGRPYERRNKKKRPMDYYRKLETRQSDVPLSGTLVNGDSVAVNISQDVRVNSDSCVIDNVGVTASEDIVENDASCHHKPTHVVAGGDASSGTDTIKSPAAQSSDFSISNQLFTDDSRTDNSVKSVVDTPTDVCLTDVRVQPSGSGDSDETVHDPSTAPSIAISPRSTDGKQTVKKAEDDSSTSNVPVASPESQPDTTEANTAKTVVHEEVATTKQTVSSWAGLFKGRPSAVTGSTVVSAEINARGTIRSDRTADGQDEKGIVMPMPVPVEQDTAARQLGQILLNHKVCHRAVPLLPRGLCNRGNWCYVNATLQALLACPPFYHLLKAMPSFPALSRGPSSTPVIDSLVEFVNEFSPVSTLPPEKTAASTKAGVSELHTGLVFEPVCVYKMLQVIKYGGAFKHGRQEDAEEFLGCVLDSLHEEMVAAMDLLTRDKKQTHANGDGAEVVANGNMGMSEGTSGEDEDGQWEEVKPRGGKGLAPRSNNYSSSPTSDIFRGQIRSILHQSGARESPTLQPFYTLQLDIQSDKVWTLKDALDGLVSRESLQGYTCAKTKQQVEATRRILLEKLPVVLILHLKCFVYDKSGGCQKITNKQIEFPVHLEMSKDLLSPTVKSKYSLAARKYKLFAVVNHHGTRAIGGHYTTDVFHPGVNGWIHMDDSGLKQVSEKNVLKQLPPTVPYLLYYRRVDTT